MEKRLSELDEKVLKLLLPLDGSWSKMQLVFDIGEVEGISHITVQRKIKELKERGFIERWKASKNQKGVYYRRYEGVRIEKLINDAMQDISETLDQLPGEISDIEKQLIEGSITKAEGEKAVEILRNEPAFLKGQIMNMLVRKVCKLLNDNLPEPLRGKDYYIGVFDEEPVRLVPRSIVEDEKEPRKRSVKS